MQFQPKQKAAPTLGLIGGGQLAKMTAQAASQFGCDVVVLERNQHSPSTGLASHYLVGDWDDPAELLKLGALVDVVTLENEFVDATSLAELEERGHLVWPTAATMRTVQDKLGQKQALADASLPVPRFCDTPTAAEATAAGDKFGWPLLLKKRRDGYDGKGNVTVRSGIELAAAWEKLNGDANALFAEEFIPFQKELAVMITRSQHGESVMYPVVDTVQFDHICHIVKAPAALPDAVAARARDVARRAVEAVGGIGTFGVELFLTSDDRVLINELAPRVHNSGHYTIEGCVTSQFENHVRAVFGWPLGSTALRAPAAVMINLLGVGPGPGEPFGWREALAVEGAALHIYGKSPSARGRKMGHVTALGETVEAALATAQRAANCLRFGNA
ncbi:MAG: 5-(carboxyamino)imidazole ribonucleotide synthase [Verrucomicrobia bacterium]|nr:5-(carboxyamino)imidazole ribonucleotide synthase [Verrucomicrobiota bacterium]